MLEQRHAIRFLLKEGIRPKEIPARLLNVYHQAAMKKSQISFAVGGVGRGRENLADEERPGRPPTASLDEILAYRLERDPHVTARRLAASLGISPQTMIAHLYEGFGMKYFHLRLVLHAFTDSQKAKRLRFAQEMIEALDTNSQTGFKYLLTGDESWITYDQSPTRMRAVDRSCAEEGFVRPVSCRKPWSLSSLMLKKSRC
jgi:hypothetical protein